MFNQNPSKMLHDMETSELSSTAVRGDGSKETRSSSDQKKYAKDEAILARFGKKQQLRVS